MLWTGRDGHRQFVFCLINKDIGGPWQTGCTKAKASVSANTCTQRDIFWQGTTDFASTIIESLDFLKKNGLERAWCPGFESVSWLGFKTQLTCKGVNKRQNPLGEADFESVLQTKRPIYAVNNGFRVNQGVLRGIECKPRSNSTALPKGVDLGVLQT